MDDDLAKLIASKDGFKPKALTAKGRFYLHFATLPAEYQGVDILPKYILGPGRGNGHWIAFGPLRPLAYETLNLKGTWQFIFNSLCNDYQNPNGVVLITCEVYQQVNQGRPKMLHWTQKTGRLGHEDTSESEEDIYSERGSSLSSEAGTHDECESVGTTGSAVSVETDEEDDGSIDSRTVDSGSQEASDESDSEADQDGDDSSVDSHTHPENPLPGNA